MPALTIAVKMFLSELDGPKVAMILVFRIYFSCNRKDYTAYARKSKTFGGGEGCMIFY